MQKTNAARILDRNQISYELREYKVDEDDLSAENVAAKVGVPIQQVFKTLVARGDKTGILVACIPGNGELNLKLLASVSGNKKVEMVSMKEIQGLTGYIRGGVSPLGMKKNYPVYIDNSALKYDTIMISAGQRGMQILVSPTDLIEAIKASMNKLV